MTNTISSTVTDEELDCIIQIESGGRPDIKAPTSSALGLGQFLNATWLAVVRQHRPDLFTNKSNAQVLALRTNPRLSIELLARFTEDNKAIVGRNCAPGDLYLAHFLGAGTAQRLFRAPASTPAIEIVGEAATRANESILRGKTVGDVRAWAAAKMAKAGGKGWVKKFSAATPVAKPTVDVPEAPEPDPEDDDEDLRDVKISLKGMNYNPGGITGKWGGMTAGAIAGFINDRGGHIQPPASLDAFQQVKEELIEEINEAEADGFKRPVTEARASGDIKEVAKVAPSVVPAAQTATWTLRGAITAFVTAAINFVSSYLQQAWNWLVGNKDSIPTDPETLHTYWGYAQSVLHKIPPGVWLLGVGVLLGVIYWNVKRSVKLTTEGVATGQIQ